MATTQKKALASSQIEKGCRKKEQRPRVIIESCSDITALLNIEDIVTYVSPSITSIIGYAPEEIVGYHAFALVHPDEIEAIQSVLREVKQSPGKSLQAEYRFRCKDGSWRWFEGSYTNLLQVPGAGAIVSNFRDITKQRQAPHTTWSEMSNSEHFVQFYETDGFLLDSLSGFIGTGLGAGDACIVITSKIHQKSLEERLEANGLDLATAHTRGKYFSLDAAETLSKFMTNGMPEPERFAEVIGSIIVQAAKSGHHVRIFGDMVALLWTEGNQDAAIRLEELWNDLHNQTHAFSLFCAYSMHSFDGEVYGRQFTEICHQHTRVIPDESYTALTSPNERLRTITLLQQKANSLEAEIAERKVTEERLRVSENRYRRLFEESRDGVLMVDPDTGEIIDANPFMTEFLGYPHEQLLAKQLWQIGLFKDQEANQEFLRELWEKQVFRYEALSLQTKDGECREAEFVSNLYQENDHKVIQCNIRDISERKAQDKRKDEFISMASHELKTPVTSLKGFLNLLQRRMTIQGNEKELHYLDRMDTQIHKLINLINDLLDLSKMQTGQLAYRVESFNVDSLVQEIIENIQGTTQTHHLLLDGQTQAEVFGDRDRIGQVLINFLNNAIKYSPQADKVLIRVTKDHDKALVSVQDFGIGISKEHQQKIFERFYQVTDPAEKTYPGLGIGLYISWEIVQRHGGQIWVESKKGEGATFHFTLPLLQEGESKHHRNTAIQR